ncbi:MAG: hypothetical protein LUD50_00415 [Clostridia bacterium]|nr:hypothetical protein [Clostridia bacterium]
MIVYDFDEMFDKRLTKYISDSKGKYTEEEWEDRIPQLYDKFGDTVLSVIGTTPRKYYAAMSDDEIIKCLRAHVKENIPVSSFLCLEIQKRRIIKKLMPLLEGSTDEQIMAMNLIGDEDAAIPLYLEILVRSDDEEVKERASELIKAKADLVADAAISNYRAGRAREYMLDILSRSVRRRDDIFRILIDEFRGEADNIPLKAGLLASYGDERALPYLQDRIEEEGISYVDFRELKFAIEALGGVYTGERDFSEDRYYEIIKAHDTANSLNIFGDASDNGQDVS